MLRSLRDDENCQDILCSMLEFQLLPQEEAPTMQNESDMIQEMLQTRTAKRIVMQHVITNLQSTQSGKAHYAALCQRQMHLKELVNLD